MVVHDVDRQVCTFARESWNKYVTLADASGAKLVLDPDLLQHVWEFIHRTILNPSGMYLYVNPPQPVAASPVPQRKGPGRPVPVRRDEESSTRAKTEEEQEEEQDRKARLRVGAFGSAEWVISGWSMSLCVHEQNDDHWFFICANSQMLTQSYKRSICRTSS